jgi:predicted O-linked N-acetylglucosamine transferase (SPINDLY family)
MPEKMYKVQMQEKIYEIKSLLDTGLMHHQSGNIEQALIAYREILKLDENHFDALHLSGLIAAANKNFEKAVILIKRALKIKSNNATAHSNLGIVFFEMKKFDLAIQSHKKSIKINSKNKTSFYNLALAFEKDSRIHDAIEAYKTALSLDHSYYEALVNLGNLLQKDNKLLDAIYFYNKSIDSNPRGPESYNNRGNVFHKLQRYADALRDFDIAIELNPRYYEAFNNRGNTLHALRQQELALKNYDESIRLNALYPDAHHNRANLLREMQRYEAALKDFDTVLTLRPNYPYVLGQQLATKMNLCEWSNYDKSLFEVCRRIEAGEQACLPFVALSLVDEPVVHKKAAHIWADNNHPTQKFESVIRTSSNNHKIKLGYFSADFHEHATMYLMAELLEVHNRERFEIIGFSFGPKIEDQMRRRAELAFSSFYDVRAMSDKDVASLARGLQIDIAVDLKGYTLDSRTSIFSYRAAPIQVSFLGFPGTMAVNYIDYIIADEIVIPKGNEIYYSEKIAYLPHSYQVNGSGRKKAQSNLSRRDWGLPENVFTYCCFNNNYKITPQIFDVWMRILMQVEGSVLWLLEESERVIENLKLRARENGVNPDRIIFAKKVSSDIHLERQCLADLFLDTFPYNAHTTASDALWVGLPILSVPGKSFASRVSASLLHELNLSELIAKDINDYEQIAIDYGNNFKDINLVRQKILERSRTSTLFDSKKFSRGIEGLYEKMYSRFLDGKPPCNLY